MLYQMVRWCKIWHIMRQLWQSDNITAYLEMIHKVLIRLQVWWQDLEGYQRESKNEMSLRCLSIRGEREKKQTPCVYKISTNPEQRSKLSLIFSLLDIPVFTFSCFDICFAFDIFCIWHFQSTGYLCLYFHALKFPAWVDQLSQSPVWLIVQMPIYLSFRNSAICRSQLSMKVCKICTFYVDISEFP